MALVSRLQALDAHLSTAGFRGYATPKTLARAMRAFEDRIRRDGLEDLYEIHQIKAGPNAGRWVGLIVLGPWEEMTQTLCSYAQRGLPIYQHRVPGRIPPA